MSYSQFTVHRFVQALGKNISVNTVELLINSARMGLNGRPNVQLESRRQMRTVSKKIAYTSDVVNGN